MTKDEAIERDRARDAERTEAYQAGRRGRPNALVMVEERYLLMLVEALRHYRQGYRLGPEAVNDREAIYHQLLEELDPAQSEAASKLAELDITYYEEWGASDK